MSKTELKGVIHPEITSIIQKRDLIHRYLYLDYHPLKALEGMVGLLYELHTEHQDPELLKKITQQFHIITRMQSRTARAQHGRKMKTIYWGYLRNINQILLNGYLSNEFYNGFFDPSKDRESGRGI